MRLANLPIKGGKTCKKGLLYHRIKAVYPQGSVNVPEGLSGAGFRPRIIGTFFSLTTPV
jgi:hypothetical protein